MRLSIAPHQGELSAKLTEGVIGVAGVGRGRPSLTLDPQDPAFFTFGVGDHFGS